MSHKAREQRDFRVNTTQLTRPADSNQGAFRCETCVASFTSYDAYLDHLHSRLHLQNAGLDQPMERVEDVERIRARLAVLRDQRARGETAKRMTTEEVASRVEERLAASRLAEEAKRRQKYENKKKTLSQGEGVDDQNLSSEEKAAMKAAGLGITRFGS